MACIRYRRHRWVLDYRDATGRRRWESYRTREQAENALARIIPASRQPRAAQADPSITLRDYGERWLTMIVGTLKPRSLENYRSAVKNHLAPALGTLRLRRLSRAQIKALLTEKRASGLAVDTVRLIHAALSALLTAAVEEGVLASNPAAGLGRAMKLSRTREQRRERVRAFDSKQLARFLAAVRERLPQFYPLFFLLSRTGLRLGEALGLRWEDLDLGCRELRVSRAASTRGGTGTPKSGQGRTVDLSAAACEVLRDLRVSASAAALSQGQQPSWMFPGQRAERMPHVTAEAAFARALRAAGLPGDFSPHTLRHTYASLLLADGVSPAYVQEQLGHASIELTVGTYGSWLRKRAPGAVDRLNGVVDRREEKS